MQPRLPGALESSPLRKGQDSGPYAQTHTWGLIRAGAPTTLFLQCQLRLELWGEKNPLTLKQIRSESRRQRVYDLKNLALKGPAREAVTAGPSLSVGVHSFLESIQLSLDSQRDLCPQKLRTTALIESLKAN